MSMPIQIIPALALLWSGRVIPLLAERTGQGAAVIEAGFAVIYILVFLTLYATGGRERSPLGAVTARRVTLSVLAGIALFILGMAAYTGSSMVYSKLGWNPPSALALFDVDGVVPVVALIAFVGTAVLLEEYAFRGIILTSAARRFSPVGAVLISALCFALYHLSAFQFATTFLWGLALGTMYLRTHSLLPPIVAHMTFNMLSLALFLGGVMPEAPA